MKANVVKEIVEAKVYEGNKILGYYNRRIAFIEAYINGGKFKDGKPYDGRPFRPFELRDLNKLLNDLKNGKERVTKFITKLQKTLRR